MLVTLTKHLQIMLESDQKEEEDETYPPIEEFTEAEEQEEHEESQDVMPAVFTPNLAKHKSDEKLLENNTHFPVGKTWSKPNKSRDECSVYSEYVSARMRKIRDQCSLSVLQHLINTALFEAEMGLYRNRSDLRGLAGHIFSGHSKASLQHLEKSHSLSSDYEEVFLRSNTPGSEEFEIKIEDPDDDFDSVAE